MDSETGGDVEPVYSWMIGGHKCHVAAFRVGRSSGGFDRHNKSCKGLAWAISSSTTLTLR